MQQRVVRGILARGPDSDWDWVANLLIPTEEGGNWHIGAGVNRMKQGERDPARVLGEGLDARSAVYVDTILMAVLATEREIASSRHTLGPYLTLTLTPTLTLTLTLIKAHPGPVP